MLTYARKFAIYVYVRRGKINFSGLVYSEVFHRLNMMLPFHIHTQASTSCCLTSQYTYTIYYFSDGCLYPSFNIAQPLTPKEFFRSSAIYVLPTVIPEKCTEARYT